MAWFSAKQCGIYLDIVFVAECSGGSTSGNHHGKHPIITIQSYRLTCKGPFAPHIDAYKQYLTDRGYAATTFSNCMRSIAHFAHWTRSRRLRVRCIDESVVTEILDRLLRECRCIGPFCRDRGSLSAALGHLLVVLRARGIVAPPTVRSTPVGEELVRYDTYMDHVRGLAPKTRSIALCIVGRLLVSRFSDGAIDIVPIKPDHVRRFFARQAKL